MSDFDRWNEANAHAEPNMLDRIAELETEIERLENINGQLADALQSPVHKQLGQARADNKRLREALEGVLPFAEIVIASTDSEHDRDHLRRARAALKETDDDT